MELRHLRYFLKTTEMLSFTRAAEALNITQSTLSHQIKELERETGQLFDRAGRGIRLTSRGRVFRAHAERIVSDVRASVAALTELEDLVTGQLAIGVYRAFETSPLPPMLASFSRSYPGVALRVHAGNHIELAHRLIDGSLDVAVAYAPAVSEKILAEAIFVEPLALMVGREHPFYGRTRITLDKLADELLVSVNFENRQRQQIQRSLSSRGVMPRVVIEMNSNEAVLALVRCSAYSTICPAVKDTGLHAVQLSGLALKRTTVMMWRRDGHRSAAAKAIAPMIRAAFDARSVQ
jgi:LysR family cyn operon transcriptional activator